jgi:hypothetical protein
VFSGSKPQNWRLTVQLKTKGFTSNMHLFAGYFGGYIVQSVNCAFYLWLLDMAESCFNNLTVF